VSLKQKIADVSDYTVFAIIVSYLIVMLANEENCRYQGYLPQDIEI